MSFNSKGVSERRNNYELRNCSTKSTEVKKRQESLKFDCDKCTDRFAYRSLLKRHQERKHVTKSRTECFLCFDNFSDERSVNRHIESRHKVSAKIKKENLIKWYCKDCKVASSSKGNYLKHLQKKYHEVKFPFTSPFECRVCDQRIHRRYNFLQHLRRHIEQNEADETILVDENNN